MTESSRRTETSGRSNARASKERKGRTRPNDRARRRDGARANERTDARSHPIERLHRQYGNQAVQRVATRQESATGAGRPSDDRRIDRVADVLDGRGGRPLPADTRRVMGRRFGHDFRSVRVYDDAEAANSARSLGAAAYTVGSDIVFGPGGFDPGTLEGRLLLAHELAHVAQYERASDGPIRTFISKPTGATEIEADRAARRVVAGESTGVNVPFDVAIARQTSKNVMEGAGIGGGLTDLFKGGFDIISFVDELQDEENQYLQGGGAKGVGVGFDVVSETLKRVSEGQGLRAIGGGATRGLTSGLFATDLWESRTSGIGGSKGASTGLGFLGSGLKLIGGLRGEKPSSSIGFTDVGEYVDVAGKAAAPTTLAQQSITEGALNFYDTLSASADAIATGRTTPFEDLAERNLEGKSGQVIQGYSMMGHLLGGLFTEGGVGREASRISRMASSGELGALPKLGDNLGDLMAEADLLQAEFLGDDSEPAYKQTFGWWLVDTFGL